MRIRPMISTRTLSSLILPFVALAILVWSGCTKYDDYQGEVYDCECGSMVWDGRDATLRLAEAVLLDSSVYRYHIVADVRTQSELDARIDPRDVSISWTIDLNGASTSVGAEQGDPSLMVEQVDAPGVGTPWNIAGAQATVQTSAVNHTMSLTQLNVSRGGVVVSASGEFTFDLVD